MANTTVNVDIQVQSKTLGQLEDQLTEINDELRQVEVGSQAFKDLTKEAQALNREVEKVNEENYLQFESKLIISDPSTNSTCTLKVPEIHLELWNW